MERHIATPLRFTDSQHQQQETQAGTSLSCEAIKVQTLQTRRSINIIFLQFLHFKRYNWPTLIISKVCLLEVVRSLVSVFWYKTSV